MHSGVPLSLGCHCAKRKSGRDLYYRGRSLHTTNEPDIIENNHNNYSYEKICDMATPRSSRGSSIDHTFTPESHPRTTTSMSIPKSECLRNALEARRAQKTPVQSLPKLVLADTPVPGRLCRGTAASVKALLSPEFAMVLGIEVGLGILSADV